MIIQSNPDKSTSIRAPNNLSDYPVCLRIRLKFSTKSIHWCMKIMSA